MDPLCKRSPPLSLSITLSSRPEAMQQTDALMALEAVLLRKGRPCVCSSWDGWDHPWVLSSPAAISQVDGVFQSTPIWRESFNPGAPPLASPPPMLTQSPSSSSSYRAIAATTTIT